MTRSFLFLCVLVATAAVERRVTGESPPPAPAQAAQVLSAAR